MKKEYLIFGADTCIGYALCKRLMTEKDFRLYGINTKFNHYGNKCFQYAFNRNIYDEIEVYQNNSCREYLMEKTYDAIFWCDDVWTEYENANIYRKVNKFFRIMDGINYRNLFFWAKETVSGDVIEIKLLPEKSTLIKIPNIYGIYQEREGIIPKIILNDKIEGYFYADNSEKFISAWSIAEAVIDNDFVDLHNYTFSVSLKNLVFLLEDIKKNDVPKLELYQQLLKINDLDKVKKIIYYLLETIEFYKCNEIYYRKKEQIMNK